MRAIAFLGALYFFALFLHANSQKKELVVFENNCDSTQITFNQHTDFLEIETFDYKY